jgi:hypothetical protein
MLFIFSKECFFRKACGKGKSKMKRSEFPRHDVRDLLEPKDARTRPPSGPAAPRSLLHQNSAMRNCTKNGATQKRGKRKRSSRTSDY